MGRNNICSLHDYIWIFHSRGYPISYNSRHPRINAARDTAMTSNKNDMKNTFGLNEEECHKIDRLSHRVGIQEIRDTGRSNRKLVHHGVLQPDSYMRVNEGAPTATREVETIDDPIVSVTIPVSSLALLADFEANQRIFEETVETINLMVMPLGPENLLKTAEELHNRLSVLRETHHRIQYMYHELERDNYDGYMKGKYPSVKKAWDHYEFTKQMCAEPDNDKK